jgi:hypothetical protein
MESFATSISFQDIKTLCRAVSKKEKEVLKIDPAYSKLVKAANYLDKNFNQCMSVSKDSKKTLADIDWLYLTFSIIPRNYEFEFRYFPTMKKKYQSLYHVTLTFFINIKPELNVNYLMTNYFLEEKPLDYYQTQKGFGTFYEILDSPDVNQSFP